MTTNKKGDPLNMAGSQGSPSKHRDQNTTNAPSFQVPWTVKALANSLPTPPRRKLTTLEEENRVLDYLLARGTMTTAEARTILGVWEPGKRVKALRERGIAIDTIYGYLLSESESRYRHTWLYVLRKEVADYE